MFALIKTSHYKSFKHLNPNVILSEGISAPPSPRQTPYLILPSFSNFQYPNSLYLFMCLHVYYLSPFLLEHKILEGIYSVFFWYPCMFNK